MVLDDIDYVIGPVGSGFVSAASNILDWGGVLYAHYGLNQAFEVESSLGVLGMPMLQQSLSLLYHTSLMKRASGSCWLWPTLQRGALLRSRRQS